MTKKQNLFQVLIKPKDEKPPKFGDPRGKEDFGDDVPRDAMPKPPVKTPPPAKVITPIAEGNAVVEIDEPRTHLHQQLSLCLLCKFCRPKKILYSKRTKKTKGYTIWRPKG